MNWLRISGLFWVVSRGTGLSEVALLSDATLLTLWLVISYCKTGDSPPDGDQRANAPRPLDSQVPYAPRPLTRVPFATQMLAGPVKTRYAQTVDRSFRPTSASLRLEQTGFVETFNQGIIIQTESSGSAFPRLLPPPETNGLTTISRANCLSVASFCTADVHLFGSGYPRSGQGIGAPFGLPFRAHKR